MTMPYDIARCQGRMATRMTPGAPAISINIGHVECLACQRRTNPGRPDGPQSMMGPPPFERGHCPQRIAPTPTTQPAQTKAGFFFVQPHRGDRPHDHLDRQTPAPPTNGLSSRTGKIRCPFKT